LAGLEVEEKLGPSNPFQEEVTPKEAPVDIIMQSIQVQYSHYIQVSNELPELAILNRARKLKKPCENIYLRKKEYPTVVLYLPYVSS
jgi:hypothetical protein